MRSVSDFFILSNRNLNSIDDFFTSIKDTSRLAVTCFVGVIIGLAALGIFGTILMACCQKYRCRYLLYFICVILFVFAIIIFLLAVSFSISAPILSLTCDFFTVSTANSTAFKQNLGGELGSYLSVCLPGGSGDFINQFQGVDLSALNGMNDAI